METVKLSAHIDPDGHLRLDLPTNLPTGEVELVIVMSRPKRRWYNFADLLGKLAWKGDALATQRALRDEW
jgi:hypothetical protein